MLVGTVAIIVVFGISQSEAAFLVGRDKPGGFGSVSVLSKVIQAGILIIAGWMIVNNKRTKLNPQAMKSTGNYCKEKILYLENRNGE